MFSSEANGQGPVVEAFAGHVHLAGIRLELERVEVRVSPPSVSFRVKRDNWVEPKEHAIEGAHAVFSVDTAELLVTALDSTLVVEGARLVPV